MHLSRALAVLLALAVASAPAAASAQDPPAAAGSTTDVVPMAVWTLVSVLIFGIVGTVFYLLKRRVGGFPAHPAWTAPITIMPSKDFADEGAFGNVPADAHGAHH